MSFVRKATSLVVTATFSFGLVGLPAPAHAARGDDLTPVVTISNKTYDGNTTATGTCSFATGVETGDDVGCTFTAVFADKNAGDNKAVSVSGITLTGTNAGQYGLTSTTALAQANITPAVVTAALNANDKNYDSTTEATGNCVISSGVISDDTVTCTADSPTFDNKYAGLRTVTATAVLGGADAGNYTLGASTSITDQATITALTVDTVLSSADDKTYDGSTAADADCTVDSDDVLSGDVVDCAVTSATFNNENVGTDKPVTGSAVTLGGADAGGYTTSFDNTATVLADITAAELTAVLSPNDKTYDGTTDATATCSVAADPDLVSGDAVTCTVVDATFSTPNGGTNKTVNATVSLSGADAGNYTLASDTITGKADIDSIPLTQEPWYSGQTFFYTKNLSDTAVQATLTASFSAADDITCSAGGPTVADAKVTFRDQLTDKILAKDVAVSEVDGQCDEGIATTIATLSTGTGYVDRYVIVVEVTGSFTGTNTGQRTDELTMADTTVTVSSPTPTAAGLYGVGELDYVAANTPTNKGTEGTLTADMGGGDHTSFAFGFTYGKKITPRGRATLLIPGTRNDGSGPVDGFYYVKTNSITSVTANLTDLTRKTATIYAKASITWAPNEGLPVSLDGSASVRLDLTDGDTEKVGFTVQSSKTSALLYSNEWTKPAKTWLTLQNALTGDTHYVSIN